MGAGDERARMGQADRAVFDPPGVDYRPVHLVQNATGLLRSFNEIGVLVAADVHVARHLGRLGKTDDDAVLLAAALAVRAPRLVIPV